MSAPPTWLSMLCLFCSLRTRAQAQAPDLLELQVSNAYTPPLQLCGNGYEGTPGNCRPVCQPQCVYAQCTGPQQCTCNAGYEATPNGCQPICEHCAYGDCIAPNVCRCWPAFAQRANEGCRPLAKLLLPPQKCQSNCSCWHKYPLPRTPGRCINACDRYNSEPCLDLSQCLCNSLSHHLVCSPNNATQQYVCALLIEARETDEFGPRDQLMTLPSKPQQWPYYAHRAPKLQWANLSTSTASTVALWAYRIHDPPGTMVQRSHRFRGKFPWHSQPVIPTPWPDADAHTDPALRLNWPRAKPPTVGIQVRNEPNAQPTQQQQTNATTSTATTEEYPESSSIGNRSNKSSNHESSTRAIIVAAIVAVALLPLLAIAAICLRNRTPVRTHCVCCERLHSTRC